jgi:hypothetical protein
MWLRGQSGKTNLCLIKFSLSKCFCMGFYFKFNTFKVFKVRAIIILTHQSALGPRGGLSPVLLVSDPKGRPVSQQWGH